MYVVLLIEFIRFCIFEVSPLKNENVDVLILLRLVERVKILVEHALKIFVLLIVPYIH